MCCTGERQMMSVASIDSRASLPRLAAVCRSASGSASGSRRGAGKTAVAAALVAAAAFASAGPGHAQTPEADRVPGMAVSVTPARNLCFEDRVDVSGTVVPRREVVVGPDHDGLQVSQVLVDSRDEVTPGQILARVAAAEGQTGSGGPQAVRSPVTGIVEVSNATPGEPASTRQTLFRIIAGGDLDLQAEATSADLAKVAVGQTATVTPLGASDMSGIVKAILPAVSPTSQLGHLRIEIDGGHEIRVGTFAHGRVVVGRRCGLGVPSSAVMYPPDGTIVDVVVGHQVQVHRVGVGLPSGTDLEIQSGLAAGDVVIVRAGAFLRDGEQVNPILSVVPAPAAQQ